MQSTHVHFWKFQEEKSIFYFSLTLQLLFLSVCQVLLAILHLITLKFLPERDGESSEYSEDQGVYLLWYDSNNSFVFLFHLKILG